MDIKSIICTVFGLIGAGIANLLGGWDNAILTLIIFISIDYISGVGVAIMGNSLKTATGGLNSAIGFKGLCKKGMILLMVFVAVRLDIVLGTDYIRNVVIIGYIANELISITDNSALLGLPVPNVILKAIDVLKSKSDEVK
jgi:toxin secretion/phage lysis holin